MLGSQFYPAVAASNEDLFNNEDKSYIPQDTVTALSMVSQIKMQNPAANGLDVLELINVTTDPTDTDGDGLPDAVESILGTDINATDSDFDQLDDYNETVLYLSDPLEMDSNYDGLTDNFEVTDVSSLDVDSDGVPNIWDFDNDDDGVEDNVDSSPFARSTSYDYFNFDISTNGNPVYIDFQLVPQTSSHVRLAYQELDWPFDNKSTMQDLDGSTDDLTIVPLLELTMDSVPEQVDVDDYGLGISGDRVYVPLFQVNGIGGETALAGKMFYPESTTTDVHINASLLWLVQAKTDSQDETNGTISTESTTLITYREDFTLTGLSVEESYGSDVGILYTDDINQSIGTNFMMAYSFLRNNQSTLQDMPSELTSHNITISSEIDSFEHRDLGLSSLTTEMTPNALDLLPDGRILPVISAFQNDFAIADLSDLGSGSYIVGNDISVDMSSEPVISLKTLQTNWYNTTDNSRVDSESMLGELESWGNAVSIDADSLQSVMALSLVWSVGESKVISVGGNLQSFEFPVEIEILNEIQSWTGNVVFVSFAFIDLVSNATEIAYRAFFATKYVLETVKGFLGILLTTSESLNKTLNVVGSIAKGLNGFGEVLGVIGIVTMIAGFVLDVGFALWGFFNIAMSEGWSNTGTFQGAVYASIMIAYAAVMLTIGVILLACAAIPTVGWIIALVGGIIMGLIGLTDFVLGLFGIGFSDFVSWVVDQFHQTYPNTECSLGMINTSLDLRDNESNGLDLGDRIIFRSYINGTVTRTSDGTWEDVQNSYIIPSYSKSNIIDSAEALQIYWSPQCGDYTNTISVHSMSPDQKNTTYEAVSWIEPASPMINFPYKVAFKADYKIIYTDRRIEWDFWNGYKYTTVEETGSTSSSLDTLFFDVLPNNIDDLVRWSKITALDYDHDGLANGDDPYQWSWDADGDGLSDAFEINKTGSDPSKSDKDGDGLNDRMELIYGTNMSAYDTDSDNMSDYLEISGWWISFNYCNQTFNMTVYSDPLSPDSDRDGLGDEEEYLNNLNPMSPTNTTDTDGEGLMDVIETAGWDVTFTNESDTYTVHVGSEPLNKDTDYDGLSDFAEYSNSSNPRDTDSDDDGLSDLVEINLGTDILDCDTDGDHLDDNIEIIFGSDPLMRDTDGDFLSDRDEFYYGTDPNNNDTDGDGLTDEEEEETCTSMTDADTDDDLIPDGEEEYWGEGDNYWECDACNPDIDGDGLLDGYEVFYNTSMYLNDTDGDGILDGQEIDNRTDPRNNDTDGDGLSDLFEIMNGTDPTNGDTDGNGLNDSEDPYSFASNVERIWASYDEDEDTLELIENLEKYTNVTVFNPEDIGNYSDKENVLFVGRPETDNTTAGNITMNILASVSPDILSEMQGSDYDRFAVEYDVWSDNQTVVMLSHPYPNDHYKVLELFKTGSDLEYLSAVSQFKVDSISNMGLYVMVELKDPVRPSIELTQYDEDELSHNLSFGLSTDDLGVKYLDINVSDNVMNGTVNNIQRALIVIYYTGRDLDMTGDLDGNDVGDIDESKLSMVWYNETSGLWEKMGTDMDWVHELGINTDNDVIDGKEYEGYMWANISHFSTYGLSGGARAESVVSIDGSDDDSPLDSDRDGLFDFVERRMGTDPFNADTDGDGVIDSKDDTPLGLDISDEAAVDTVKSDEPTMTPDDAPISSESEGGVPDNDDASVSFWVLAATSVALLAGIVVLKRKE